MAAVALDLHDPREVRKRLEQLSDQDLEALGAKLRWRALARKKQLPPDNNKWDFFGIKSGRGFGKTVAGARWIVDEALADPGSYNFVIAPTHEDLIKTCFYGPTGIHGAYEDKAGLIGPIGMRYPVLPPKLIKHSTKSPPAVVLVNDAQILGFSADVPERLRGPQCFPGETLVSMADGTLRRIDCVRAGDFVQTRRGPKKVLYAWKSGRNAELWELRTKRGRTVRGTMRHPIWVAGRGFVPLWELRRNAQLCTTTDSNLQDVKMGTSSTRSESARVNSESVSVRTFTGTSTQKRSDPSRESVTFIMRTGTVETTNAATSKRLLQNSMRGSMSESDRSVKYSARRLVRACANFGAGLFGKLCGVLSVKSSLSLGLGYPASSAATSVGTNSGTTLFGQRRVAVWNVVSSLKRRSRFNTSAQFAAGTGIELQENLVRTSLGIDYVKRVGRLATRADVYDLTIEGEHEFFAGGVLVHNCHRGWMDEVASWRYAEKAFDNFVFGLRLGRHPQVFWTGTPKPKPFIHMLMGLPRSVTISGSTYENAENLSDIFYENIAKYEGTRIGRQEIHGEIIDPEEAGFVKRSDIRLWPAKQPLPKFRFVVMSLDTAFTEETWNKKEQTGDPTACTVWGLFEHQRRDHVMLLDAWEEYLGFPDLIRRVKHETKFTYGDSDEPLLRPALISRAHRPSHQGRPVDLILIEDTGSGKSLIQTLAVEGVLAERFPTDMDKLSKLHAVSPLFPHGRVWAVESLRRPGHPRDWAEPVISQLCTYVGEGSLVHDDLLDTATQALLLMQRKFNIRLTVRADPVKATVEAAERLKKQRRSNPYDG